MIMRRLTFPLLTGVCLASLAASSRVAARDDDDDDHGHRRDQSTFRARLRPENEVPVCSATGTGSARLKIDDAAQSMEFEVSYALEGTVTVSHVHLGQKFAAGGVSFFFCGGGGKPACPASPATITGTVVAADIVGPVGQGVSAGEVAAGVGVIRDRNSCANVHRNLCPGGEVRAAPIAAPLAPGGLSRRRLFPLSHPHAAGQSHLGARGAGLDLVLPWLDREPPARDVVV